MRARGGRRAGAGVRRTGAGNAGATNAGAAGLRAGARGLNPSDIGGSSVGGPSTGSAVDIIGTDGKFVARGLYDAKSAIAVRVVTLDRNQALDASLIRSRVALALRARRGTIDAATTTAFRWLNGEGDFLPGVVVDVYGTVAILRLDGDAVRVWRDWVVAAVVDVGRTLGITHVYERSRGGRGEALHGGEPPSPIEIREHDVRFSVDIMKGQKTGFFLDQRENRRAIRAFAGGVDVVNLFGYTGGFSVNAALAGAHRVTTVDVAAPALVDARANFTLNGIDPTLHGFDAEDAFDWLERARTQQRRFGLVITDPPSFAPSEKALQKALTAYRDLHQRALAVVDEGGIFVAASCSSHVTMDAFIGTLRDAADKTRRPLRLLEVRGQPADHPTTPAFPEGRYLKCVICRAD
jgi:23S rRNA (cytosine1962-C5)-methyltransferase